MVGGGYGRAAVPEDDLNVDAFLDPTELSRAGVGAHGCTVEAEDVRRRRQLSARPPNRGFWRTLTWGIET